MRRVVVIALTAVAVAMSSLLVAAPAQATPRPLDVRTAWKHCDTFKAGFAVKATFFDPARNYGTGKYKVKKQIKWGGAFLFGDKVKTETNWIKVRGTKQGLNWDFATSIGDRHKWGSAYYENWYGEAKFTLIKQRRGPDKKVQTLTVKRFSYQFPERGGPCFSPGGA